MKLIQRGEIYILECEYSEKEIPKALGFTWWSIVKDKWATMFPSVAVRAYDWAEGEAKESLHDLAARQRANFEASMATMGSGKSTLHVPDGLHYLHFQEAGIEQMVRLLEGADQ